MLDPFPGGRGSGYEVGTFATYLVLLVNILKGGWDLHCNIECFANESPSSSSYSASSRAETFRLKGRALLTIFFNFSSDPSRSGKR